jgi:hypothetical protein
LEVVFLSYSWFYIHTPSNCNLAANAQLYARSSTLEAW